MKTENEKKLALERASIATDEHIENEKECCGCGGCFESEDEEGGVLEEIG